MNTPELSIITVTHNRQALLELKLASLCAQTLAPERFEWIVCLNGDTEGTAEVLKNARVPFCLKTVTFKTQRSPGVARNACAKLAAGQVLYLSDDDCVLGERVLEQHLHMQRKVACVAIGSIRFEAETVQRWRPARVNYWNLNGANTSLSKAAFDAVGGFDERLEGYGGEDVLLGYKLKQAGLSFTALPEAEVRHLGHDPARARNLNKAYSAGRNAARIAKMYPELAFRLGLHPLIRWAKRLALLSPLGYPWRYLDRASFDYERAYLQGALEEDKHG